MAVRWHSSCPVVTCTQKYHHPYRHSFGTMVWVVWRKDYNNTKWNFHESCSAPNSALTLCTWVTIQFNTLRPRQNGRHFADDTFKRIFLNENVRISIRISLKFVPKGPMNNIPALVQIMAWRRPGDKPLSEPMMVRLPTQIWVTRPQWVKGCLASIGFPVVKIRPGGHQTKLPRELQNLIN